MTLSILNSADNKFEIVKVNKKPKIVSLVNVLREEFEAIWAFDFGLCVLLLLPLVHDNWNFDFPMFGVVVSEKILTTRILL